MRDRVKKASTISTSMRRRTHVLYYTQTVDLCGKTENKICLFIIMVSIVKKIKQSLDTVLGKLSYKGTRK